MPLLINTLVKSWRFWLITVATILLAYGVSETQRGYNNFTITLPNGRVEQVQMPIQRFDTPKANYWIRGDIEMGKLSSQSIHIIPDDRVLKLLLNGEEQSLEAIDRRALQDYRNGFVYDFDGALKPGVNKFELLLWQGDEKLMGLSLGQETIPTYGIPAALLLFFAIWCVLGHFKIAPSIKYLILAALLIRLMYWTVTPHNIRPHDLDDHYGYITYMAEHWAPPSVEAAMGGAFFHPPLYYYLAGATHKVADWVSPNNLLLSYQFLQFLSLLLSMMFVFYGLRIIDKVIGLWRQKESQPNSFWTSHNSLNWLVGALFAFWPVSIIHSVRIGNDPLLYALFTWALYHLVVWFSEERESSLGKRSLIKASVLAGLTILAKANGVLLVAVAGLLFIYKMVSERDFFSYLKLSRWPLLAVGLALAITFAPGVILKLEGKRETLYVDNINNVNSGLIVEATPKNFLWFDVKTFVTEPFTSPWDDRLGRQFFWNYLGKTGLFGEFNHSQKLTRYMAEVISFLSVIMLIYTLFGMYKCRQRDLVVLLPIILAWAFQIAGVTYMRATFPVNIDFRYVVPTLVSFTLFMAMAMLQFDRLKYSKLVWLGAIISLLFTFCSCIYILGMLSDS